MVHGLKSKLVVALASLTTVLGLAVISANADTVTVGQSDTVWGFSQKYNVSIDAIENANNINKDTHLIVLGQVLNIPTGVSSNTSNVVAADQAAPAPVVTQKVQPAVKQQTQVSKTQQPVAPKASAPVATTPSVATNNSAKEAIAFRESRGSYTAQNGKFYGKFQLDRSYLKGDYSPANQERTADAYVASRYGSWENALQHSNQFGWY